MEAIASDQQQTDNPFQSLKLASHDVLERALQNGRSTCHRCNGSRMFYCYTCHALLKSLPHEEIPEIKLPLNIDIIKHPNETDGKSTAVHAKLLAPNDVNIYIYPCIPEYEDLKHEIVLLFPGVDSISVEDIPAHVQKMCKMTAVPGKETTDSKEEPFPKRLKLDLQECSSSLIENKLAKHCVTAEQKTKPLLKKAVFIDSTWNQTGKIITDERLRALMKVELKTRKTCFWRHQKGSPKEYLSTIEAIYYFLIDYHKDVLKLDYKGEYDNLLFFFSFMHRLIKTKLDASKP